MITAENRVGQKSSSTGHFVGFDLSGTRRNLAKPKCYGYTLSAKSELVLGVGGGNRPSPAADWSLCINTGEKVCEELLKCLGHYVRAT